MEPCANGCRKDSHKKLKHIKNRDGSIMSKQGMTAIEELKRLIRQRVSVSNIRTWIGRLEWVDQMYSPERHVLQGVLALFAPGFDMSDKSEVVSRVKNAKNELRTIVQKISRANGCK